MSNTSITPDPLNGLLVDTWWFALTRRLPDKAFMELVEKRVQQGFTAVQLVVGIPPEVGPEHESAASPVGFPWTLAGTFNEAYLAFARQRIAYLNAQGLRVIVYGAWGHQIEWLGQERMTDWWRRIITALDDLDVVYCLTGESNIWLWDEAQNLLPDKTTTSFPVNRLKELVGLLPYRVQGWLINWRQKMKRPYLEQKLAQRRRRWSQVLADITTETSRPFIVHTLPHEVSHEVVDKPELLAAITTQTGHSETARHLLWQRPLAHQGRRSSTWSRGMKASTASLARRSSCLPTGSVCWPGARATATAHTACGMWATGSFWPTGAARRLPKRMRWTRPG